MKTALLKVLFKGLVFWMFFSLTSLSNLILADTPPQYYVRSQLIPERHQILTDLTIKFSADHLEDAKVQFMIANSADIKRIRAKNMIRYEIIELDESLKQITVFFEQAPPSDIMIHFEYTLSIPTDHKINRITTDWIELNIDSFWHPVFTSFPTFHYELELKIDSSYQLKSGDIIKKEDSQSTFSISSRMPRRDISFSAAKDFSIQKGDYVEVYSVVSGPMVQKVGPLSDQVMSFLKTYIDEPADFTDNRTIIISPREEVGYARQNYIVLSDISRESEQSLSSFIAHEFSHYWFSEADLSSKHHWITESFAEYLSMIYLRETYGKKAFKEDIKKKQQRIKKEKMTLAEFEERPSYLALYHRGPLVLYHFEKHLGQKKFRKLLNRMVDLNVKSNEELFAEIKKLFGEKAVQKLEALRASI